MADFENPPIVRSPVVASLKDAQIELGGLFGPRRNERSYYLTRGEPAMASKGRVMVVDDEPLVEEMMQEILHDYGYETASYNDPVEALSYFEDNPDEVDLVLADLTMPKMTGLDLAGEVLRARPDKPVILITGHGGLPEGYAGIRARIRTVLTKPVQKAKLKDAVEGVLQKAKS
jgi:DNA-binding NtrC family response regulator